MKKISRRGLLLILAAGCALAHAQDFTAAGLGSSGLHEFVRPGSISTDSTRRSKAATETLAGRSAAAASMRPSSQTAADVINVREAGATGDGVTDDAQAIMAAIDQAASINDATTSTRIYFPPGKYRIATPISKTLTALQTSLIFEGVGSASQILLNVAPTETAIFLYQGAQVTFRNLTFIGPETYDNIGRGLSFRTVAQALIQNCHFYGVHSTQLSDGGVIYAYNSRLTIRDSSFRGCSGNHSNRTGVITLEQWRDFFADNLEFIDFGQINQHNYIIKSGPDGWIRLGNVAPISSGYNSGGYAVMRNVVSDEGAPYTVRAVTNDGSTIQSLEIDNWRGNNGVQKGFWLSNINRVLIHNSQFSYEPTVVDDGFPAVQVDHVTTLEIERSAFLFNANAIYLGAEVKYAKISNSAYKYIQNVGNAKVEEVKDGERNAIYLATRSVEPPRSNSGQGVLYIDSNTGKLRASLNGSTFVDLQSQGSEKVLEDDFTSNFIDATKWRHFWSGVGAVSGRQSGGTLNFITSSYTAGDSQAYYESVTTFDLSKSGSVVVRVPSHILITDGNSPYWAEELSLMQAPNKFYTIRNASNGMFFIDDVGDTSASFDGNSYWRISYEPATKTVRFETSMDGNSWTLRRSQVSHFIPSAVRVQLRVRAANTGLVQSYTKFDDFHFTTYQPALLTDDGEKVNSAGDIEFAEQLTGVVLKSPGGKRFRLKVDDSGAVSTTEVK
jgi:hypothetical protein